MKNLVLILFILIPILCHSQWQQNLYTGNKNLQFSINTSGGDISNGEGSVSYSIGQVNYLSYNKDDSYTSEGVQQPLIISIKQIEFIEEIETFTLAAYPNPVTDYFMVEASSYTNRSLKYYLTDLNGNLIKEGTIEEPGTTIDVSRLAVAIYILNITDNTEHIKTFRILKK